MVRVVAPGDLNSVPAWHFILQECRTHKMARRCIDTPSSQRASLDFFLFLRRGFYAKIGGCRVVPAAAALSIVFETCTRYHGAYDN